jgi:hypothetical protein
MAGDREGGGKGLGDFAFGEEKAFEKFRFRPTYAGANMGHPDAVVEA